MKKKTVRAKRDRKKFVEQMNREEVIKALAGILPPMVFPHVLTQSTAILKGALVAIREEDQDSRIFPKVGDKFVPEKKISVRCACGKDHGPEFSSIDEIPEEVLRQAETEAKKLAERIFDGIRAKAARQARRRARIALVVITVLGIAIGAGAVWIFTSI